MKQQAKRRPPAKKPRAIQASRHLHVVPHKHTGHLTHRRTTSYPTLVMIVLCLGVFLVSWSRFVTADSFVYPGPKSDSYVVHASVPGPPPTQPALIDTPDANTSFDDLPITVAGSCPFDTYVSIYRNNVYSGSALCDQTGRFSLEIALFEDTNQLQARVYSLTDVPGPMSNTVPVVYDPPEVPVVTMPDTPVSNGNTSNNPAKPTNGTSSGSSKKSNPTSPSVTQIAPLLFKTDFKYQGHYTGEASTWQLDLSGGSAPYAISVDWGDGTSDVVSRQQAGTFSIDHTYRQAGQYKGSYVVKFSATDARGVETYIQLIAIANNPPGATGVTTKKTPGIFGTSNPDSPGALIKYIWPSYLIVVLMLLSFWLGERREYKYLKPRLKKTRHA